MGHLQKFNFVELHVYFKFVLQRFAAPFVAMTVAIVNLAAFVQ